MFNASAADVVRPFFNTRYWIVKSVDNWNTDSNAAQWPSGSSNGYAYYHRVDQVNGGDQNSTHTTGFSKKEAFWFVTNILHVLRADHYKLP